MQIGGNHELKRMLPLMQIHLLRMQFQAYITPRDREKQFKEYQTITDTILAGDGAAREKVAFLHVRRTRLSLMRLPDEAFPRHTHRGDSCMAILITGGTKGIGLGDRQGLRAPMRATCSSTITATMPRRRRRPKRCRAAGGRPHLVKADAGTPEGCATIVGRRPRGDRPARSGRALRRGRLCDAGA